MRIVAYIVASILSVCGWAAVLLALLGVSPWLALGWVVALALALLAYLVASPAYRGNHAPGPGKPPSAPRTAKITARWYRRGPGE